MFKVGDKVELVKYITDDGLDYNWFSRYMLIGETAFVEKVDPCYMYIVVKTLNGDICCSPVLFNLVNSSQSNNQVNVPSNTTIHMQASSGYTKGDTVKYIGNSDHAFTHGRFYIVESEYLSHFGNLVIQFNDQRIVDGRPPHNFIRFVIQNAVSRLDNSILTPYGKEMKSKICECGATKVNSTIHSTWCPLHE